MPNQPEVVGLLGLMLLLAARRSARTTSDGLDLENYYLFHAVRADMLRRLGRDHEAATAYEAAITRTKNDTEREFLERRLHDLSVGG